MSDETEKMYARLAEQEREINNLRQGYVIVNTRYNSALKSLRLLSANAREAVKQADIATQKAAAASNLAASVASDVVSKAVSEAAALVAAAAKKAVKVMEAGAQEVAVTATEAAAAAAVAAEKAAAVIRAAAQGATVAATEASTALVTAAAAAAAAEEAVSIEGEELDAERRLHIASGRAGKAA